MVVGLYSCTSNTKQRSTAKDDSVSTDTTSAAVTSKKPKAVADSTNSSLPGKWTYSEEEDKMSSKKAFFAAIEAKELLDFDFPYNGGSTATITVRNQGKGNEVVLEVSKGQFNSSVDGATVKIRFDGMPASSYRASEASDGSSNILFIENTAKLIKKMKAAKKMLVQAEFYDSGEKVMEFNVEGFKWDH